MKISAFTQYQAGMVLLLCLFFLMALTMLGLSASADTILQNKLTANLQETERAKQSALATLTWAEDWLLAQDSPALEQCSKHCAGVLLHVAGSLPSHPEYESYTWWTEQGHETSKDPLTGNLTTTIAGDDINKPIWIIESVHSISPTENGSTQWQVWYRILARGNGRTSTAVSVIESMVFRTWPLIDDNGLPNPDTADTCSQADSDLQCGRLSWRELR